MTPEMAESRARDSMVDLVNDIDRSYLRGMQAEMHHCAARCCENKSGSAEQVQMCVETCGRPLTNAHNYIQKEMSDLQNRLNRCLLHCQDVTKDKLHPSTSATELKKFQAEYEKCSVTCVEDHIGLVPVFMQRMKEVLTKASK